MEAPRDNPSPLITLAIPSFNQGRYLDAALRSVFAQGIPVEVFVLDGGSTDETVAVLRRWESSLAGWWSQPDDGQSWAINRGVSLGSAPYVAWLNADDLYLPDALWRFVGALQKNPALPAVYGRCRLVDSAGKWVGTHPTFAFHPYVFANYCFICQPGTLIRRDAWEAVGGVDESLDMCMDYDLWWRLYRRFGPFGYIREWAAAARIHPFTKTSTRRADHYREAMQVVRRHWGRVPLKWYLAWPYKVSWLEMMNRRTLRRLAAAGGSRD